jgi:hypothetical protein
MAGGMFLDRMELAWRRLTGLSKAGVLVPGQAQLDLSLHLGNGLLQKVRVDQDLADQHDMLGLDPSSQGFSERR